MEKFVAKRGVIAWCLYDWANSAFPTIILTFVFATYFTEKVASNKFMGTAQWGGAVAIAGVLIAIMSPIVGSIADNEGRRKPWILLFTALCVIASGLLWYVQPHHAFVMWALIWLVVGTVGLEVSMVFYNAMLRDLAPPSHIGRLSGWAWGVGYFGGLTGLVITLVFFINSHPAWLDVTQAQNIRIGGPFVALWFMAFAWPMFVWTPDRPSTGIGLRQAAAQGLRQLGHTLRHLPQHPNILWFLIARMIYIDGLNTIFAFGGIYAAGTFHMTFSQVVEFGIAMNVAAGIGAVSFAWLDDYVGPKPTILVALVMMIICGSGMLIATSQQTFWMLGLGLSVCVGPVQAASRSLMVRLAPAHLVTEMFGLYALSGKATAFMGPWILGAFTLWFSSQRVGMSTVMVFLFIGAVILLLVKPRP